MVRLWMNELARIVFEENDSERRSRCACRLCGETETSHALSVDDHFGRLYLYKCNACLSFYFDGDDPVIGYETGVTEAFWLDYAQAGAGITTMLAPIFAISPMPKGPVLDVGCGFGFVVDFWSKLVAPSIGLEKSYYGQVGKDMLQANIQPYYLDEFVAKHPTSGFDIIYSSEVIEHVPSPKDFLDDLNRMLIEDTILILTTPSTTAVSSDTDQAKLIAALSPGFHYTIISEQHMAQMLERCDLNFKIETHGNQMIVWASRSALPEISYGTTHWDDYLVYLEQLTKSDNSHLRGGALYRLFKDSLNIGKLELARKTWPKLVDLARRTYSIDLLNPDLSELMKINKPLARLDEFPSWLGQALLFGGLHVGNDTGDRRAKLRMIDAALRALKRRATVDLQFGQEAELLLPFAETQYTIALAEALNVSLIKSESATQDDALIQSLHALKETLSNRFPSSE